MNHRRLIAAALVAAASASTLFTGGAPAQAADNDYCDTNVVMFFYSGVDPTGNADSPGDAVVQPATVNEAALGSVVLCPEVSSEPFYFIRPGVVLGAARLTDDRDTTANIVNSSPGGNVLYRNIVGLNTNRKCAVDQALCDAGEGSYVRNTPVFPINPTGLGAINASFNGSEHWGSITYHTLDRT